MAPELDPPIPCISGSLEMLNSFCKAGSSSSVTTRAYLSSSELYSVGRLVSRSPQFDGVGSGWSGRRPGLMNTPSMTGISRR